MILEYLAVSGEGICLFVARRALVALNPDEIDGFALAAQFAHYVPDVSGHCLARSGSVVTGPDGARRV
jgi:hypothetical protein